jgi:hypothetical protein
MAAIVVPEPETVVALMPPHLIHSPAFKWADPSIAMCTTAFMSKAKFVTMQLPVFVLVYFTVAA